jgi:hypothetical protein
MLCLGLDELLPPALSKTSNNNLPSWEHSSAPFKDWHAQCLLGLQFSPKIHFGVLPFHAAMAHCAHQAM